MRHGRPEIAPACAFPVADSSVLSAAGPVDEYSVKGKLAAGSPFEVQRSWE